MSKIKAFPFILIGTAAHILLGFAVIRAQLNCGIQPHCVPASAGTFANILGFPLNLVSWMWQSPGGGIPSWAFLAFFLNSVLSVTIIWFVLNALLKLRAKGTS
ncbi:hypothetical protein [Collimonas silvisoli]|uniref:hypothetical protein n=1 Tax=Collimonas silvisoli TaxID=2825884 RepID=UPI001B8AF264|nr:hypothetical protein [Collimonas silvisoli]